MSKLQCSRTAKACAIVLLLACSYAAGIFGIYVVESADSAFSSSWQDTQETWRALAHRNDAIEEGVGLYFQLQALKQQVANGEDNVLTQGDQAYLEGELDRLNREFDRKNTWFRYRLMTADGKQLLATNLVEGESFAQVVKRPYSTGMVFSVDGTEQQGDTAGAHPAQEQYRLFLEYGLPEQVSEQIQDEFYEASVLYNVRKGSFDTHLTGFLNLSAVALLAMLYLLWACGHKAGEERIVLTWQENIFLDLYLFAMFWVAFFLCACIVVLGENVIRRYNLELTDICLVGAGLSFMALMGTVALSLRTIVVRLKAGVLARTTLLCRVVGWTVRTVQQMVQTFVRNLPLTWKILCVFGVYFLFTLFALDSGLSAFVWLCLNVVILVGLTWWSISLHRLREGTRAITSGDLDHKIDTKYMPMDLRLHAEDLNNISVGMQSAVEEQMKSERFKAELITNVSHDLKTPLTSIINYVNLLKATEQTDPKAVEYIEVLDRKSQRLKKLTEDLVEASKASTGVLSVNREKIGMCQLLDQALGEYGEKLETRHLSVIRTVPEEEVYVYADGRHLWRVIDNLLANCAKYAMEGTRVYVEVSRGQGRGVFSVKNISKEPLNVPAEQLMERFVRGDSARSTEGSGLGLSIARSLTELQAGSFDLAVDGDLFKAVVSLPQYGG